MRLFVTLCLVWLCSVAGAQDSISLHYKIYDTRSKQVVTIDKIVADMVAADVLFFGEEHNDSAGHYLENRIYRALHAAYGDRVTLTLEMFETDNQLVLDEYLQGKIDENRLGKDARLWSNYKDYRPLIEFAKQNCDPKQNQSQKRLTGWHGISITHTRRARTDRGSTCQRIIAC